MPESIRELREICQKPLGGKIYGHSFGAWLERNFYRKISIHITKPFLKIGVSANQATLFSFIAGVAGGIFLIFPDPRSWIIGGLLVYLYELLDRTDGEIARYHKKTTIKGEYWDDMVGTFFWNFVFICVSIGVYNTFQDVWALIIGFIAVLFYHMLEFEELDLRRILSEKGISTETVRAGHAERSRGSQEKLPLIPRLIGGVLSFALTAVKVVIPLVAVIDCFISPVIVGNIQFDARYIYLVILAGVVFVSAAGKVYYDGRRVSKL